MSTAKPAAALALVLLAACGGGDAPEAAVEGDAAAPVVVAPAAAPAAAPTGDTITIRMVTTQSGAAGVFEPADVTAQPGDVLKFVSDGGAAHNVNFAAVDNPGATNLPSSPSAYAMADGQALDVPVTFPAGTYTFRCDPHMGTGMKGVLTVTS